MTTEDPPEAPAELRPGELRRQTEDTGLVEDVGDEHRVSVTDEVAGVEHRVSVPEVGDGGLGMDVAGVLRRKPRMEDSGLVHAAEGDKRASLKVVGDELREILPALKGTSLVLGTEVPTRLHRTEDSPSRKEEEAADPRWPYLKRWSSSMSPVMKKATQPEVGGIVTEVGENVSGVDEKVTGKELSSAAEVSVKDGSRVPHGVRASEQAHVVNGSTLENGSTVENGPTAAQEERASGLIHVAPVAQGDEASCQVHGYPVAQGNEHGTNMNEHGFMQGMETEHGTTMSDIAPQTQAKFVPTLGAWAKPLFFKPPPTPPNPSTPRDYDPAIVGNQLAALWPSLNDELLNKPSKSHQPTRTLQPPIEKLPPPELKADGKLRFPWAARFHQSRNLYRAATPTYRIDGTPQISIPSKVLKLGPENKDEYIIGKFHRCSLPPGGLIHAVANRIWGRSCKISCKKISDSSYMFHIPHEATRRWVIQRGVWHIDDCLLFVLPWTPEDSFKITEVSTLPVWVNLKNIPDCCYSRLGISHVASGLGEPILTHKPRLDPTSMGEAKVLVEMELDRDFPKIIALDDKQGSIFLVNVEYTWIPSTCERCGNLGHKSKRCLQDPKQVTEPTLQSQPQEESCDIPVVDIDVILQNRESQTSSTPTTQPEKQQVNANLLLNTGESDALVSQNLSIDLEEQAQEDVHAATTDLDNFQHETRITSNDTLPKSTLSEQEKPTTMSNLVTSASKLVDSESAPFEIYTMDSSPSVILNNEDLVSSAVDLLNTQPIHCEYESPSQFAILGNVDEVDIEPSNSFNLTRGGRESKPPNKYQNMEWKTVRGRGKRGRRGRGSSH